MNLRPVPGPQKAMAELCERFEVFVVTAATKHPNALRDKLEWIEEFFPSLDFTKIVFSDRKDIINADYLIDDHPRHLSAFPGKPILFEAWHNIGNTDFDRLKNWLDWPTVLR